MEADSQPKPSSVVVASFVEHSSSVQKIISSEAPFGTLLETIPATQQSEPSSIPINEASAIRSDASVPTQVHTTLVTPAATVRPVTSGSNTITQGSPLSSVPDTTPTEIRSHSSHIVLPSSAPPNKALSSSNSAPTTASESVGPIEDLLCGGRCKPCATLFGMKACLF